MAFSLLVMCQQSWSPLQLSLRHHLREGEWALSDGSVRIWWNEDISPEAPQGPTPSFWDRERPGATGPLARGAVMQLRRPLELCVLNSLLPPPHQRTLQLQDSFIILWSSFGTWYKNLASLSPWICKAKCQVPVSATCCFLEAGWRTPFALCALLNN